MTLRRPIKSTNGRLLNALGAVSEELAAAWAERLFLTPRHYAQPQRERDELAGGLFYELRFDDGRTAHRVATWRFGAGPAVLLAHGWSGRGGQLGALVQPLVAAGFSVLVFDAPAHGQSAGKRASLVDFARTIREIDRQLGPLCAVVGHSMGGSAAAIAVRDGLAVERLVTIGSPASLTGAAERFAELTSIDLRIAHRMRRRVERRYARRFEEMELTQPAPEAAADLTKAPPLLIVHDRKDREVTFDNAEALAAAWPAPATQLATEGLGHKRLLRDHAVIDAVVRFVAEGRPTAARADRARAALLVSQTPDVVYGLVESWG